MASNPAARTQQAPKHRDPADILAVAFGTTVAMWGVGYLGRMPIEPSSGSGGGHALIPSVVLFFGLALVLLAGGFVFGRCAIRRAPGVLGTGVLVAVLNLLILLSLREQTPLAFIPGSVGVIAILFSAGAGLGRLFRLPAEAAAALNWRAALAGVAVGATSLLLLAGGVVTGFQAGLAVPDWPNSFGYNMFLFPLAHMTGGIFFEHAHRLLGSLVGLTTLVLAVYLQLADSRRWVQALALIALAAVIVQGVLGGLRVTQINIALAITHGVLAQVFFSTLVALMVFLTMAWRAPQPAVPAPGSVLDRRLLTWAVGLLLAQIMLGALQRHVAWGLHVHLTLGVIVALLVVAAGMRSWGLYENVRPISRVGGWLAALITLQLVLGVASYVAIGMKQPGAVPSWPIVAVTTFHQSMGAVLLACSTALLLWHHRLLDVRAQLEPSPIEPLRRARAAEAEPALQKS
jgi:cytochrome c oxidase assembly protein subunit 15